MLPRFEFQFTGWFAAIRTILSAAYELELRIRKRDDTYRWFLVRFDPLRDEQGQITRWYVALTDDEDRKQAEDSLRSENVVLREEIDKASMFEEIVGTTPALKNVLSLISKVAPSDSTVIITGETGTGKELVARAIHRRSDRVSRRFVGVNCAAIPRDLIASELFGHEKGAYFAKQRFFRSTKAGCLCRFWRQNRSATLSFLEDSRRTRRT
jgi:formate hydrogenlyase transcriptional activator